MVWPVGDLVTAVETFGAVAAADPLAALLLAAGAVVLAATFGVVGALVLGALSNLVLGRP